MSRTTNIKRSITIVVVAIAMVLLAGPHLISQAYTGILIGSYEFNPFNGYDFTVELRDYYNANSSYSLNLHSQVLWVYNYGAYNIDEWRLVAQDGAQTNVDDNSGTWTPVTSGNHRRFELVYDEVYLKNTSAYYAFTAGYAGYSYFTPHGWDCFWYKQSRSVSKTM